MTLAHMAATVVLAVVLARADTVVAAVGEALSIALPLAPPSLPAWSPLGIRIVCVESKSTVVAVVLRRVLPRRGPPRIS